MTSFERERNRWQNAMASCVLSLMGSTFLKNSLIPKSILSQSFLSGDCKAHIEHRATEELDLTQKKKDLENAKGKGTACVARPRLGLRIYIQLGQGRKFSELSPCIL